MSVFTCKLVMQKKPRLLSIIFKRQDSNIKKKTLTNAIGLSYLLSLKLSDWF